MPVQYWSQMNCISWSHCVVSERNRNNRISLHRKRKIDLGECDLIHMEKVDREKEEKNQTSITKGTGDLNGNRDLSVLKLAAQFNTSIARTESISKPNN